MKKNGLRRKFLSYLGMLPLIMAMPVNIFASNKIKKDEKNILVNGWMLKREDLNDI